MKRGETVILAAGDFPRKGGVAWDLLTSAKRVVCCDSAANAYRRRFRRWPTVTVGDMDSAEDCGGLVVRITEQDTNDLVISGKLVPKTGEPSSPTGFAAPGFLRVYGQGWL